MFSPDLCTLSAFFGRVKKAYALVLLLLTLTFPARAESVDQALATWQNLTTNREVSPARLYAFLLRYPEWPEARDLQRRLEMATPDLSDAQIRALYTRLPPITAAGIRQYLRVLSQTEARQAVTTWWPDADLTLVEQDTFIQHHEHLLTRSLLSERFNKMLFTGRHTQARALAPYLGHGYRALADARIALATGGAAEALIARVPQALQKDPGLVYERLRYRRKNKLDDGAIALLLSRPDPRQVHNADKWWDEQAIIIRRLIEKRAYRRAYQVAAAHFQTRPQEVAEAEWLAGWLALRFLDEPYRAFQHFDRMYRGVKTPLSKGRAAYWAGRASDALNYPDIAAQWYRVAARYPTTFYGQLAAGTMGGSLMAGAAPIPPVSSSTKTTFDQKTLVTAARRLHQRGDMRTLHKFLVALRKNLKTASEFRHGIEFAKSMGRMDDAVELSKEAGKQGFFMSTLAYPDLSSWLRSEKNVEWALVHAIIRQESAFDTQARSPAGALGLMQLLPATAREVARKNGLSVTPSALTSNPRLNVKLGTAYLGQLLRRYDGSYVLAAAAYNAGPGRVSGWLGEMGHPNQSSDLIDWIELIPIEETRNYVQRILEATMIYRTLLPQQPRPALHGTTLHLKPDHPIHMHAKDE